MIKGRSSSAVSSDAFGRGTSRSEIESLIMEIVKNLPQDMSLKEAFCVGCRMDLALLALDRLLPTIPGKFPILLFNQRSFALTAGFSC
jgi:hypothetical protein